MDRKSSISIMCRSSRDSRDLLVVEGKALCFLDLIIRLLSFGGPSPLVTSPKSTKVASASQKRIRNASFLRITDLTYIASQQRRHSPYKPLTRAKIPALLQPLLFYVVGQGPPDPFPVGFFKAITHSPPLLPRFREGGELRAQGIRSSGKN